MSARVKGETLKRIWKTFQLRGHDRAVAARLEPSLLTLLQREGPVTTKWYPIEHYLALYGTLLDLHGYDEVVETACESVTRGLRYGSWGIFVPFIAGIAPETFCQRGARRFADVYKVTFDAGEATVTPAERPGEGEDGADALIVGFPLPEERAWRAGVSGGLLSIVRLTGLAGTCTVTDAPDGAVRFALRWKRG